MSERNASAGLLGLALVSLIVTQFALAAVVAAIPALLLARYLWVRGEVPR